MQPGENPPDTTVRAAVIEHPVNKAEIESALLKKRATMRYPWKICFAKNKDTGIRLKNYTKALAYSYNWKQPTENIIQIAQVNL